VKLILLSDPHLLSQNPVARKDNLVEVQFEKFEYVLDYAERNEASLLIAGDFCDKPRSWHLLPRIIEMLRSKRVTVYAVYGQHDTYLYSEATRDATNLGVLAKSGIVTILGKKPIVLGKIHSGLPMIRIYGCHHGEKVPKTKKIGLNILVVHAPIALKPLWSGQHYMDAEDYLDKHKSFDLILCGDIHRKFLERDENRLICNTGPMLRKTAEEYSFEHKPGFFVYDTVDRSIDWEEISHKKAASVLSRDHIEDPKEVRYMLDDFIDEMSKDIKIDTDLVKNIYSFIEANDIAQEVQDLLAEVMQIKEEVDDD